MAEIAGKVGAIYAPTGDGIAINNEAVVLTVGAGDLAHTNVSVSKVTSDAEGNTPIANRWTVTVKGHLTVEGGGTDTVYVTYQCWSEGQYGNNGEIGQVAGFFNWSLDRIFDVLDATDFGDSGHRTYISSLEGWTASAEQHWLLNTLLTNWIGKKLIIKFYEDVGDAKERYEGWAIANGIHPTTPVDAIVSQPLDFQGTEVLSHESG